MQEETKNLYERETYREALTRILKCHYNQLTVLDLSYLRLKALPPEIWKLTSLTHLSLNSNELTTLPLEIGNLTSLTLLDLKYNRLSSLPIELRNLRCLERLLLAGNPSLGLPDSLVKQQRVYLRGQMESSEPGAILDYYFGLQDQGVAPLQEVRLLLVGRGRVGKSSLLKRLQGKDFDPNEKETPGISVEKLELECGNGDATAHAWDFGGQEFLHGTHQIFLSERCIYMLVIQGRESNWEAETDYWLRFIESFGGDSPVIVALNKYDDHAFSVDEHRLKERCPQIEGFVKTDALTGLGIDELKQLLERTVGGMPDVWLGVPKMWHRVKEELEGMGTSFLSYEDYQKRCTELGVTDEGQQDSLAQALHRLGIALNFRAHHRLRNTSVLKPEWVTEAVYGLIRYAQKMDQHGLLHEAWFVDALKPAETYPLVLHGFVVNLMEKFEVAFLLEETDEKGKVWLIPELLDEKQPDAFHQFRGADAQRLRFTYPSAIPPGLLPRLIVRTEEMSKGHPNWRWRTGVVLEWGGCQALVRLDRLERQTEVAVIGDVLDDQQGLFDIIRAHLLQLHSKVPAKEETEIHGEKGKWVNVAQLRQAERRHRKEIEVFINDEEKFIEVSEELDQVESDDATEADGDDPERRVRLFISYAHVDEKKLIPFKPHLILLSRRGYIQVWHDRDLVAGEKWEKGILEELNRAEIVLIFYTTGARISNFIQDTELPVSLERFQRDECAIIWVPLERNDLDEELPIEKRLSEITCGTIDKKGIYLDFSDQSVGWVEVEDSIRKAVKKRRSRNN